MKILLEKHPVYIRDLAIDGTDLADMGITGIKTGQVLSRILEKVWENPHLNTKENLVGLIEEVAE